MGAGGDLMAVIRTPLGIVILLVVILILAGLSVASAISGELTLAAASGASVVVLVILLAVLGAVGKK